MTERTLNALIIGPSGAGKSWLGSTTPPPRLIVDLEGRAKYTPNGRGATWWDGISDPMELRNRKSPTSTYIVTVTSLQVLDQVRQWLRSGAHPFKSVTVDSLMEFQFRATDKIKPGTAALQQQDWGSLLRIGEQFLRDVRDMTMIPATKVKVAVFIAGATRDRDIVDTKGAVIREGMIRPLLQGQTNTRVPFIMDVVGYLESAVTNGEPVRRLWISQRPQNDLEVKDGTGDLVAKYGPFITNPDFSEMYESLLPEGGESHAVQSLTEEGRE